MGLRLASIILAPLDLDGCRFNPPQADPDRKKDSKKIAVKWNQNRGCKKMVGTTAAAGRGQDVTMLQAKQWPARSDEKDDRPR